MQYCNTILCPYLSSHICISFFFFFSFLHISKRGAKLKKKVFRTLKIVVQEYISMNLSLAERKYVSVLWKLKIVEQTGIYALRTLNIVEQTCVHVLWTLKNRRANLCTCIVDIENRRANLCTCIADIEKS
jgi:hypothetical protein